MLSERELLKSHWYFPRPGELKDFQGFLEDNKEPGSPAYIEACLIGQATVACREVDTVLQWRIHQRESELPIDDSIVWTTQYNADNFPYAAPAWHKNEHGQGNAIALLVPPIRLVMWLGERDVGFGSPRLIDLLPVSETDWATRAYACLAKALKCNVERAKLIARDLVPRLVYHRTANSVLAKFWRSSLSDRVRRDERVALSHYVQISGSRALDSYVKACKLVFGETSMSNKHQLSIPLGQAPLNQAEVESITSALRKSLAAEECPIARHRCIAHLVLFVCIAGTGHRRSTKPFPFPWDFNLPERLVFIADKLITGSEARFVPLAPTVIQYLEFYADHLHQLSQNEKVSIAVRDYARLIGSFIRTGPKAPAQAVSHAAPINAGVFFAICPDGQQIDKEPIPTHQLDRVIRELTQIKRAVQRLRPSLASYCWENGASGRSVQALLGHQPELHSNGPASTWSIRGWADEVEPLIETYLCECGISPGSSYHPSKPSFPLGAIPSLKTSTELGYEGRQKEKEWARQRAKSLIKREIHSHILEDKDTVFSKEDVQQIQATAAAELEYDAAAASQIAAELKRQLNSINERRSVKVTAATAFLGLSTPGPIDIDFSRSLRIACVFQKLWESNVGVPIGDKTFDSVERLAHLVISLVCFDAVLVPLHLQGVVEGLAAASPARDGGGTTLRANILSRTHDYHFSVQPGEISTALAYGTRPLASIEAPPEHWESVAKRVNIILRKLLGSNETSGWDIRKLCHVYRPYWLIRQPGAMYAVAIGDYVGPAADAPSEAKLLGAPPETVVGKFDLAPEKKASSTINKMEPYQELRKLFADSRGVFEGGESIKQKQRAALRNALNSSASAFHITKWRSETQIVELLFSFIGCLLEKGGKRVKMLAFSSMEKYFSLVAKEMIELAWDTDFESIDKESLIRLLEDASANLSDSSANTVLAYFNSHLRDEFKVPYCGPKWSNPEDLVRIRSCLVFPKEVDKALTLLLKDHRDASQHGALLQSLMTGYGSRPKENFGVTAARFDPEQPTCLSVTANQIAGVKSASGRRYFPTSLNRESAQAVVHQAVAKAHTSPHKKKYLFEDSTDHNFISKVNPISHHVTAALRQATGNSTVVPYHLRHTFGTALVLGIFALQNANLHNAATRLLGSGYPKRIKDMLRLPADWPFAVNAAGVVMGHISEDQLLNTYFHGSSLVIAAYTQPWQHTGTITDIRLAAMLGRERTGITKLRKQLAASSNALKIGWQDVVQHFVGKPLTEPSTPTSDEVIDITRNAAQLAWVTVPRMLVDRLQSDISLEEMATYATRNFAASPEVLKTLLDRYKELVVTTELDDFEPPSSELLSPTPSHNRGVYRGRLERDRFLARTQQWLQGPPERREALGSFLKCWEARVDAQNPRLVCINQRELDQALSLLKDLGADSTQLLVETHGDPSDLWLEQVFLSGTATKQSLSRASRGSSKVRLKEVSIAVRQKTGQQFPDGRDFHRAMISICVAWHALSDSHGIEPASL